MSATARLICVTGSDGAGKSTQVEQLEALLGQTGKRIAVATIWDLLLQPETRDQVVFKTKHDVEQYLRVLHPIARGLFLFSCMHEALNRAMQRPADIVLVNAYWYKYYATEIAHGAAEAALLPVTAIFPEPEATFYLKLGLAECVRRKRSPSAYECGFPVAKSESAFADFQRTAHRVMDQLSADRGWIELDGSLAAHDLTQQMVGRIDHDERG